MERYFLGGNTASGFKGFLGMRNFTMETEDGEMLACANSIWSYVNMETGHPVLSLIHISEPTRPY
mgnify:CR=1 FL=1